LRFPGKNGAGGAPGGVHITKQISRTEDTMFEQGIFADSLLETSWAQRTRRSWTTLTSFGLEALVIGLLLLLPLWKTVGLPSVHSLSTPISLGRPTVEPLAPRPRSGPASPNTNTTNVAVRPIMQPSSIPTTIDRSGDDPAPPAPGGAGLGLQGLGRGFPDGLSTISGEVRPVAPPPPAPVVRTFRTSSMVEGNLIRRVQPVYPPLARTARIQGPVVLAAVINKAGAIENLRVLSGPPMLVKAALDAVSEWRYRPYILNSEPVEVETQITVNFTLGGS
jgi:periplasmic protein TonB